MPQFWAFLTGGIVGLLVFGMIFVVDEFRLHRYLPAEIPVHFVGMGILILSYIPGALVVFRLLLHWTRTGTTYWRSWLFFSIYGQMVLITLIFVDAVDTGQFLSMKVLGEIILELALPGLALAFLMALFFRGKKGRRQASPEPNILDDLAAE